jgi:hypothetical protein
MSNNAIYEGDPYHVIDVEGHEVALVPVEEGRGQPVRVDVMARGLVIDPKDDQWAAARRPTYHPSDAESPRQGDEPLPPSARP